MPANKKYLTKSPWQRLIKISAGFVGGYILTEAFHMALLQWWNTPNALITLRFFGFILWATLMIFAFMAKNGIKIWGVYLLATAVLALLIYLT